MILSNLEKRLARYIDAIPFKIKGLPCLIGVVEYLYQPSHKGSPHTCWSDLDYKGYEEIEYLVLDRKGYKAAWLARKVDENLDADIRKLISRRMKLND